MEPVIGALIRQRPESVIGCGEIPGGLPSVHSTANPVTVSFSQFPSGVGEPLRRSECVQLQRLSIILRHTLAPAVEPGERVLGVLVAPRCRLGEPLRRRSVILLCPKPPGVHLADAVLHIAVGALPLHGLEGGERLGIPRMGLLRVSLHASAVHKHPTQVMHGQGVAVEGLLHEEAAGLLVILGRLVISVQKRPCPLVSVTPHHGGRRFAGLLRHIRTFRLRFRLGAVVLAGLGRLLDIRRREHLGVLTKPHRFLHHQILDPLELLLLGEGETVWQVILIGPQHFFPQLVPQVIGGGHAGVLRQLVHDLIHHSLQRRLEVAVLFFAGGAFQPLGQFAHELLDAGILQRAGEHLPDQLLHDLARLPHQLIPALGLLPVDLRQLLAENILCQSGLDPGDALLIQKTGAPVRTVADHVDMGMRSLVVVGGVPPKLFPRDIHSVRNLWSVGGEEGLPLSGVVVAEAGGILPAQGDNRQPHVAGVVRHLLRDPG